MTHIANYPSKKAFKAAVEADASSVYLDDPSIFDPVSGDVASVVEAKGIVFVTNHPKRSWYANVRKRADGQGYKVE